MTLPTISLTNTTTGKQHDPYGWSPFATPPVTSAPSSVPTPLNATPPPLCGPVGTSTSVAKSQLPTSLASPAPPTLQPSSIVPTLLNVNSPPASGSIGASTSSANQSTPFVPPAPIPSAPRFSEAHAAIRPSADTLSSRAAPTSTTTSKGTHHTPQHSPLPAAAHAPAPDTTGDADFAFWTRAKFENATRAHSRNTAGSKSLWALVSEWVTRTNASVASDGFLSGFSSTFNASVLVCGCLPCCS